MFQKKNLSLKMFNLVLYS